MLGLLGLRIFEACGADISDLGEEHGHRVLRVTGKGGKVVLTPSHQLWAGPSTTPSGNGRRSDPADPTRHPDGPARRQPTAAHPRRPGRCPATADAPAHAAAHLRQPVTTQQPVEFVVSMPAFVTVTDGVTDFANHGEYVTAMGGGKIAAQKCVGMPLNSNKVK